MPHKFYHGRTDSVWNVSKRAIVVEINKQGFWHYSQTTGKRTGLIDTLTLARSLKGQGLPVEQAEAVSLAISKAFNATLDEVSDTFVKKADQVGLFLFAIVFSL
ncbi:hypothetical protein MLD38_015957 [Melastoma candidum]|uniref:Uncharacterized protein n=1 Tax=Melastoma candidum TaxID=119954 RepID=A0ACB9RLH8_9MYRT|nr:hypothetical protein MLD38_015957 [Melastoma candidum]